MLKFISQNIKFDPFYIPLLEKEMTQFRWLKEFVSFEENGEINIFDIQEGSGMLFDALQQALFPFFEYEDAKNTLIVDVLAFDGFEKVKVIFENGELVEYYEVNNKWNKNNSWKGINS